MTSDSTKSLVLARSSGMVDDSLKCSLLEINLKMNKKNALAIRELEISDIELIIGYWMGSAPDYLEKMGVDLDKLPSRQDLRTMLTDQQAAPLETKPSYALIWLVDGDPVGHSNVNKIEFGDHAYMHLHLWQPDLRQKGLGTEFIRLSLPYFFEKLKLKRLFCEPYAFNPAPNRLLERMGFEFEKEYVTVPGSLNFEQKVKCWKLTYDGYKRIVPDAGSKQT